ncbi:extracellular solute-binding protein [Paenibacillus sp. J5C_2022]|uniref:extracellular solute-binding protein n=1 Tax=Paenibacillus sp. J5C2022 TaxID=2977129 RepID=UPI0021D31BE7|nr:extracellular solute-binding protein [Paenibacillus sp. J5C2022]MCU6707512.1 extracellular solute-binding protein [Paenibacillus sp. J5C2022]
MKKLTGIGLSVAMIAGLLAGCAGNDKNNTPKENQKPANNEQKNNTGEQEAKGPTKFSIVYPTTVSSGYHTRVPNLSETKWVTELEKRTNTELQVSVLEDTKYGVMFASNDIPDVVGAIGGPGDKAMAGSVESGVFMPLDDLLKEHGPNLLAQVPENVWDIVRVDGKIYGLPEFLSNPSRRATFIRTDLLEQTGLQPPKTIDEFLDVLRAFKEMGVKEPYQMRENFKYSDLVFGAFDVLPYKDQFEVVDGKIQPKFFDSENMMKALETMKTMYQEGLISKEFATISSTDFGNSLEAGNAGIWSHNATSLMSYRTSVARAVPEAQIDLIPSPVGSEGKGGYFYYPPLIRSFYINSKVDQDTAVNIIKFFDWMLTDEAATFFSFGIEGDTYTKDANGNIVYEKPTDKEGQEEASFRNTLWGVRDAKLNKLEVMMDPSGPDVLKAFDELLPFEGLPGIGFYPELDAYNKYPDLTPRGDQGSKLIVDHMVRMIYGKEDIADWPKVIEEYLAKGGKEILEQANERWNSKQGVVNITTE